MTLMCICTVASAREPVLPGTMLRVIDGDTVRIRLASGPVDVRLHAVDAPELGQPGGRQARDRLARRSPVHRAVQIEVTDQSDGDGRMVARVFVDGFDLDSLARARRSRLRVPTVRRRRGRRPLPA